MLISDWSSDVCSSDLSREPMLVIEIDGDTHAGQEAYDRSRTVYFEEQGYRVIRFTNRDVLTNMDGVLEQLMLFLTPPLPTLSPARSEERRLGKECVSTCRSRWSPLH